MKKYVGITIGPIFNTILDASSPMALWFASTLFSDLTRRLCIELEGEFKADSYELFSPFFDEKDREGLADGVGKYHDRIIFSVSEVSRERLDRVIRKVKENTISVVDSDIFAIIDKEKACEFLGKYLQVQYILLEENQVTGNPILAVSPYLDALELMQTFPTGGENNPIRTMFSGKSEENRNAYLKNSGLFSVLGNEAKTFLCNKKGNVRSIEDIAMTGEAKGFKYERYYAVVSADADGMGNFLKGLDSDKTIEFSKRCLEYDKAAAKLISAYGGMPIYAGGDDLLFLAPIKNGGKFIFELCKDIAEAFEAIIGKKGEIEFTNIPTVSFGISIQYVKYPLNEAINCSRDMLYRAKAGIAGTKNCTVCHLEKHSGQSTMAGFGNEMITEVSKLLNLFESSDDSALHSVGMKLETFYKLITLIDKKYEENEKCRLECPWENIFDNEGQKSFGSFLKNMQGWYYSNLILGKKRTAAYETDDSRNNESLNFFTSMLRMGKFMVERGTE